MTSFQEIRKLEDTRNRESLDASRGLRSLPRHKSSTRLLTIENFQGAQTASTREVEEDFSEEFERAGTVHDSFMKLNRTEFSIKVHENLDLELVPTLNKKNGVIRKAPDRTDGLQKGMFLVNIGGMEVESLGYDNIIKILRKAKKPVNCTFAHNPSFSLLNSFEVGIALDWKKHQKTRGEDGGYRDTVRNFVDNPWVQLVIGLLIIFDFIIGFWDTESDAQLWIEEASFILLIIYCLELFLRIYGYTAIVFFCNLFDVFDAAVIIASVVMSLVEANATVANATGLLRLVRILRFVRAFIRGLNTMQNAPRLRRKIARKNMQGVALDLPTGEILDIDLCYITSRVMVMSLPSKSKTTKFNLLHETKSYLDHVHPGCYKIYNVSTDKEADYDPNDFNGPVERLALNSHSVPTLQEMAQFCENVEEWLKKDPENVIAVHGNRGLRRSGMLVAAWLLYRYRASLPFSAIQFFNFMRTDWTQTSKIKNAKGLRAPSHWRTVEDFYMFLNSEPEELEERRNLSYIITELQLGPLRAEATNQNNQKWSYKIRQRGNTEDDEIVFNRQLKQRLQEKKTLIGNASVNPRGCKYATIKDPCRNIVQGAIEIQLFLNNKPWGFVWFNTDLWNLEPKDAICATLKFAGMTPELLAMNEYKIRSKLCELLDSPKCWHIDRYQNVIKVGFVPRKEDGLDSLAGHIVDRFNKEFVYTTDMYHIGETYEYCQVVSLLLTPRADPNCILIALRNLDNSTGKKAKEKDDAVAEDFRVRMKIQEVKEDEMTISGNIELPDYQLAEFLDIFDEDEDEHEVKQDKDDEDVVEENDDEDE